MSSIIAALHGTQFIHEPEEDFTTTRISVKKMISKNPNIAGRVLDVRFTKENQTMPIVPEKFIIHDGLQPSSMPCRTANGLDAFFQRALALNHYMAEWKAIQTEMGYAVEVCAPRERE